MEATREIYWNVGPGVALPMYLLAAAAIAVMLYGFYRLWRVWRQGRALVRRRPFWPRLWHLVSAALDQKQVLRVKGPGIPHAVFFWGFLVLFVATLLIMAQVDLTEPVFGATFLEGGFYKGFSVVTDVAGLLAVLMLAALFVRRFIVRPDGLKTIADDYLMHGLLFTILITGFFIEGLRIAATELVTDPELARYSPVGLLVALPFEGAAAGSLESAHRILWWVHFALTLGFIAAIPYTKLRHLFTTPLDYFFDSREEKGTLPAMDLEDESVEQYGAATPADLSWKDLYDADACTACKRCQDRCPAWLTDKPLSPMTLVQQVGEVAHHGADGDLIDTVTRDVLWACTTCRACQEICPAEIEHVAKIVEMRRDLVLMEGEFSGEEVQAAVNSTEMSGNPLSQSGSGRDAWAKGLDLVTLPFDEAVDLLYFVGCYAAFDPRNQKVARAFAALCAAAGLRVGILGTDEKCCGEPMRKLGNEYLYQMLAAENVETIGSCGAPRVVTACPHCFNTLSRDYRELGLELPVEHATTFLLDLLRAGKLPLEPRPFAATYHDSCYLARYKDLLEEPRALLAAAGGTVREMPRHSMDGFCCGGGGGRVLADERLGTRICVARVEEAQATGQPLLVSSCPFCLTMFEDGIGTAGCEESLQAKDLTEVLAERLGNGDGKPGRPGTGNDAADDETEDAGSAAESSAPAEQREMTTPSTP